MSDINQCTFTGRLGADPEIKAFASGGKVANLRLAVGRSWKDRESGERRDATEWVPVTLNGDGLVGIAERFLKKGSRIAVVGQFRTRKWPDRDGNDRFTTEVVVTGVGGALTMLDGPSGTGGNANSSNQSSTRHQNQDGGGGWNRDDHDDDVPF